MPVDQDKLEKLKASVRTGGKGSVRRKKKAVHKTATTGLPSPRRAPHAAFQSSLILTDDKRLQNTLKRLGVNNIPGIEEVERTCGLVRTDGFTQVNLFRDNGTVIHFKNPKVLLHPILQHASSLSSSGTLPAGRM
eukprot:754062-Hanusia_phi.AAC.2